MKAVLLAAGFATRLYPLTRDRAKPLLDVGGRPVLSWLIERVLELPGLDEVLVVVNDRFHAQFEDWRKGLETRIPVRILNDGARDEATRRGAIGDLAFALESLNDDGRPLFVGAADNLVDVDLAAYSRTFASNPRRPLVLVREIQGVVPPRRYSEVLLDDAGRVTRFREKPSEPQSNLSAVGLYFLPADARGWIEEYLTTGGNSDAPGYLFAWLCDRVGLSAARLVGTWFDIGNFETLAEARAAYEQ